MSAGPLEDFEIYYTRHGLVQVSNDMRKGILSELRSRDLSLTDLSRALGKAQSTLSVHLDRMTEEGLIASYEDSKDSRKKMYTIDSIRFAYSKAPDDRSMDMLMSSLSKIAEDPAKTRDAMLRFILLGLDGVGLMIEPISRILGNIHAMALGGSLSGPTVEETVSNARRYYADMGMGEINIYALNPLTVVLKDEMALTEDSARSFGGYAAGFLIKVLEDATGKSYDMVYGEAFGEHHNYFKFVLEPSRERSEPGLEREEGAVPEDFAVLERHLDAALGRPSVAVARSGGTRAPDDKPSHEDGIAVDHLRLEQLGYCESAALHQDAFDPDLLGQVLHELSEVDLALSRADGLLAVPFPVASLEGDHDRRRPLVQDLGLVRRPAVRVQDYADGIRVVPLAFHRQVRVVGYDGPDAHQDGVVLLPEGFDAGLVLLRGYPHLGAVLPGYLPVCGHGAVHVYERSHGFSPGVTVNLYLSSFLSTPNLTSRNDSKVSIWLRRCLLMRDTENPLFPSAIAM